MDNSKRHLAYAATFQAHQTLLSARKNLMVSHLPLFGAEPDLDRALLDLHSAHQKIGEVILLIERSHPATEPFDTRANDPDTTARRYL
jgi:hypothetical protein